MSEEFNLIAEMRDDQGKGASRRLRRQGMVPAVIYGAGRDPRNLMFDHNKVLRQLEDPSFYYIIFTFIFFYIFSCIYYFCFSLIFICV